MSVGRSAAQALVLRLVWFEATWTHTAATGVATGNANLNCARWTHTSSSGPEGEAGDASRTDSHWTIHLHTECNLQAHVYCFQQR
jgi:hypothetical protein